MKCSHDRQAEIPEDGFGLIQVILLVVVLGMAVTAGMQITTYALDNARRHETREEMNKLAAAIVGDPNLYANGSRLDFGYLGDIGALPATLANLITNPGYASWDGPYFEVGYANYADDYLYDAWGKAYQLSGVELRSFGLVDDTIVVKLAESLSQLTGNSIDGRITSRNGNNPGGQSVNIRVTLTYPNGSGGMRDSTVTPDTDGTFAFTGFIPCGNHRLRAVLSTASDTSETIVSVLPGSVVKVTLRLNSLIVAQSPSTENKFYATLHTPLPHEGRSG